MTIGLTVFELHFTHGRSLKEKRMRLSKLKARLSSQFNVSVAEVDHQDLWQRSSLAVVCVASAQAPVESTLAAVAREVERTLDAELLDSHTELLT